MSEVVLLSDSGPTLDILVKVFQFGIFCSKNVSVIALYGLKPGYYNQIFLLAEMEADDVLEAAFVMVHHG